MRVSVLAYPLIWQETLGNMPPNVLTPQTFAEDIVNHFKIQRSK